MNLNELERKLIAAARSHPPSDRVPYAFAKRIVSLLPTRPIADAGALWAQALWRSAVACLAVMLLLGALSFFSHPSPSGSDELSDAFENTMLAAVDPDSSLSE